MSFVPKKQPFSGKINAVTLGTGDKAIVIGGQNVLPFYTFDAPIEHAPKIGVEISDAANEWTVPGLKEFYAGCTTMADYAKKAEIDKHGLKLLGVLPQDDAVYRCDCVGEPSAKLPESDPVKVALKGIMQSIGL